MEVVMCSGQCDQAICRMKLGLSGLSSSCLLRLRRGEGELACSYQHTKQSHDHKHMHRM
jgi:hypothetical protein